MNSDHLQEKGKAFRGTPSCHFDIRKAHWCKGFFVVINSYSRRPCNLPHFAANRIVTI